jgi:hypothetical protein
VTGSGVAVRPHVQAPPADEAAFEAPALLRILWADPQHMAEHLAVWSLARFGPRAEAAVAGLRAGHPGAGRAELERLVIERQTRVAAVEGAFVGGPFALLIPVAFCASLLAQAQLAFELAALAGRSPTDGMRAAELLVLLDVYPSTDEAAAALAALPRDPAAREGRRLPRGTRVEMVRRMAYLLEVVGMSEERSRLRNVAGWAGVGLLVLVGFVLPLVWVPYLAFSMRRSARRLGARAQRFYAAAETGEAGVTVRGRPVVRIGGLVAFARMGLLVVLPLVVALVVLLTGLSLGGGNAVTTVAALLAVSALLTAGWLGYRRWRHRRRGS